MARDAQAVGDPLYGMAFLEYLADSFVLELGDVSLLTHGAPPIDSVLASEVSTIS